MRAILLVLSLLAALVAVAPSPSATAQPDVQQPSVTRVAGGDRVATAVAVSERFDTASTVVLAGRDAIADALVGGPLAAHRGGPLLLTARDTLSPGVAAELDRLGADQVILLGGEAAISPAVVTELDTSSRDVTRLGGETRYETAAQVALAMEGWDGAVIAAGESPVDAVVGGAMAAVQERPVLLVTPDGVGDATAAVLSDRAPSQLQIIGGTAVISPAIEEALAGDGRQVTRIAGADRYATAAAVHSAAVEAGLFDPATAWLAAGSGGGIADALAAGPAVAAGGSSLLLVDGAHLERATPPATRLRALADELEEVVLVGGPATITADAPSQLAALLHGRELPGGGRSLLPERRLVALYGSHFSPALGVLGEQAPAEVGPRLDAIVGPYDDLSDRPVTPAFDLIATIATAAAGSDGQYRSRSTDAEIQQWLDAARAEGAYLILDIQPGQADLLTEAQAYESFLREPDVGLALDPEWAVDAPETPGGGTVGSISAAEINAVSAWLADIVAEEQLPEKLLIVHNFQVRMITDRDQITDRDGVAVLLHMDGQGGRGVKLESYRILQQAPPFFNGFKVFFDEDPNPFQPAEVLGLDPVPDFISYQ